jgi:hypothetical protein
MMSPWRAVGCAGDRLGRGGPATSESVGRPARRAELPPPTSNDDDPSADPTDVVRLTYQACSSLSDDACQAAERLPCKGSDY